MRAIVVFLADTHAGHRLGLMKPGLLLYEEDERGNERPYAPSHTATQKYLWDCYQEDIRSVVDLAAGDRIVVMHDGDLTQGMKYKEQLVSTRLADQLVISRHNLEPWLALPNVTALRLVSGTGSHVLGESSAPVLIAEMLRPLYPNIDIAVCYHDRPTVDGVIFDVAHHGPSSGIREWTQGNQLRYYLKSIVMHDVLRGKHPPHLVVRGHFHKLWPEEVSVRLGARLLTYLGMMERPQSDRDFQSLCDVEDHVTIYSTKIVLLPSYCGMGEYGRKATGSSPSLSNGLVAAEIVDEQLRRIHYFERVVDLRREEVL